MFHHHLKYVLIHVCFCIVATDWADKDLAKEDTVDWANEWDDDEAETDFDRHLRAELSAAAASASAGTSAASSAMTGQS